MSGREAATMDALIAEFRALGDADRRAILARLRFDERLRFEATARPGSNSHGYSPDIAALIAGGDAALTKAARAALASALAAGPAVAAVETPHRPSLIDRLWRR